MCKNLNVQDLVYNKIEGFLNEGINYELNYLKTTLKHLYTEIDTTISIKRIPISNIKPSQFFEQYENKKSIQEAIRFKKILEGTKKIKNLRKKDYYPILVNKNNNIIIDGNHRHYALQKINSQYAVVLFVNIKEK